MDLITIISHALGIDTAAFVGYVAVVVTIANLIGRLIPDTATGWQGNVRKVAKVIGLYLGNRVAPGVSANDAAQATIGLHGLGNVIEVAEEVKGASAKGAQIGLSVNNVIEAIRHPSARPGRRYSPTDGSPLDGSPVPDEYRTDSLPRKAKPPIT